MNKSTFTDIDDFDKEVKYCLEHLMIPAWEQHGLKRLAISEVTLEKFRHQPLSDGLVSWPKPRIRKKGIRKRRSIRHSQVVEVWPEDDLHSIYSPVLVYVRSGAMEAHLADYMVRCPSQHFLLLRPGVPRPAGRIPWLDEPRQGKRCEMWRFRPFPDNDFVSLSISRSVEEEHTNSGQYYIVKSPQITQLLHLFIQEVMNKSSDYAHVATALLQAFLWLFLREIKTGRFHNRGVADLPEPTAIHDSPIEMAKKYIDQNLNHKLTIDIVSHVVFMSRANFTQSFRQETGQTFNEYLTKRRLDESKHWLLRESCSIATVCKFVGIQNSQFHRLFKQHFGMTPIEFRKTQKDHPKS